MKDEVKPHRPLTRFVQALLTAVVGGSLIAASILKATQGGAFLAHLKAALSSPAGWIGSAVLALIPALKVQREITAHAGVDQSFREGRSPVSQGKEPAAAQAKLVDQNSHVARLEQMTSGDRALHR